MKKTVQKILSGILAFLLIFCLGAGTGYFFFQYQSGKNAEMAGKENENTFDLKLPGEVEKRIITKEEVEAKLVEIGQLSIYSGEYTVSKSVDQARYFLDDIPVFGTTNTISLSCSGIVKVGYEVNDIVPTVDSESKKIYIALPTPAVLDNYVIWDSVQCAESNNILNPIDFEQYQTLINEIEQEGLAQAEEQGIYTAAEENVKTVIQNFLAGFDGYETVFM